MIGYLDQRRAQSITVDFMTLRQDMHIDKVSPSRIRCASGYSSGKLLCQYHLERIAANQEDSVE